MTFTPRQVELLEGLEGEFGAKEIDITQIEPVVIDAYVRSARQYIGFALIHYAQYKACLDPELDEKKQAIYDERARKWKIANEHRSAEVRENLVMGILSGLVPRAAKLGGVLLETDANVFCLHQGKDNEGFVMLFDRRDYTMQATINGSKLALEDWGKLSGNARPIDQSAAYEAVTEYLSDQIDKAAYAKMTADA